MFLLIYALPASLITQLKYWLNYLTTDYFYTSVQCQGISQQNLFCGFVLDALGIGATKCKKRAQNESVLKNRLLQVVLLGEMCLIDNFAWQKRCFLLVFTLILA